MNAICVALSLAIAARRLELRRTHMVERATKPAQAVLKCSLVQSKDHRDAVAEAVMLIAKCVVIKLH